MFLWMFIERQRYLSSENNPERSWYSQEATSATNDYCGQQQRSYYQLSQYNERQQYFYDGTKQKPSSYNAYKILKVDPQGIINSGMPTPPRKYVPVIPFFPEQQYHKKINLFLLELL